MAFPLVALLFLLFLTALTLWSLSVGGAELSPLEALLWPSLALLGAWALAMWLVGFWALNAVTIIATLLILMASAWLWRARQKPASTCSQQCRARLQQLKRAASTCDTLEKLCATYLALIFALTFVFTLAPPSGNDYDSLVYHLAAPLRYVQAGRVIALTYDHHTFFPFTLEMLFAAPLSLCGDIMTGAVAAKLFHWLMLPLSALLIVAVSARHLSRRAGWLGAMVWVTIPVVQNEAITAYIDLGLAAFVVACFGAFANALWSEHQSVATRRSWLIWCAVLGGFVLGSKYLGALSLGWLAAWLIVHIAKTRGENGVNWRLFAQMCGIIILLGGGWYLRNWLQTGNPVFPFAYEIFGGRGWTAEMARAYTADQLRYGFGRAPADWILLPFRLTFIPFNAAMTVDNQIVGLPFWPLSSAPAADAAHMGIFESGGLAAQTMIGPLLLVLGAPLIACKNKPRVVGFWLWTMAFCWIFWAATGQYARYLLPTLALWSAACGWALDQLLRRGALLKNLLGAIVALWCVISLRIFSINNNYVWPVVSGQAASRDWLTRVMPPYRAQNWINENLPAAAVVAIWGEPRDFYVQRAYFWADDAHNQLIDYQKARDWPELSRQLKALGATHILWNTRPETNGGALGLSPETGALIEKNAKRLQEFGGYRVYKIDSLP